MSIFRILKFVCTYLSILYFLDSYSQKQYHNWYFGFNSGIMFIDSQLQIIYKSQMRVDEGCSTISDSLGNLLFYTNGMTIWNKDHKVMLYGDNLYGHTSSVQSSIILKKPESSDIFYIFTSDKVPIIKPFRDSGICYTTVDISADNGNGKVVEKNVKILDGSVEHLTATLHSNGRDYWIATLKRGSDSVYLYLLSKDGVSSPLIYKNPGAIVGSFKYASGVGQMKFSTDGTKLVYINTGLNGINYLHLLSFNASIGELSNSKTILDLPSSPYGVEFSPNGKMLYLSFYQNVSLYQLNIDTLNSNRVFSDIGILIYRQTKGGFGSLQIGPDDKIYLAKYKDSFIGVIEKPNNFGMSCNYINNGVHLGGQLSGFGLPQYIKIIERPNIFLLSKKFCLGDSIFFNISEVNKFDSVMWIVNGSRFKGTDQFRYLYNDTGINLIRAEVYLNNSIVYVISRTFNFYHIEKPYLGPDGYLCKKTWLSSPFADNYLWNNGNTTPNIHISQPGIYWLRIQRYNCIQSDTILLENCNENSLFIPNAFSPNLDGHNDVFSITGYNLLNVDISIYNLWGERIFHQEGDNPFWDGTYQGVECSQGVYFYTIEITNLSNVKRYLNGTLTLLR